MKRIIGTSWISRGALVFLSGLLLSTCEALWVGDLGRRGIGGTSSVAQSRSCDTDIAIEDQAGLKNMADGLACSYYLTQDITLTGNWVPLGMFTGTLDGRNKTINDLEITAVGTVGFFRELGASATVKNLSFNTPTVKGVNETGVLAGKSSATTLIENLQIKSGSVTGDSGNTGGLVGENKGTIKNSYATVSVSDGFAGGLVGDNNGTIKNSYATGSVNGAHVGGGLVGYNRKTIENSYATASLTITNSNAPVYAGGLVGVNGEGQAVIKNSYATGSVTITNSSGTISAGGLVGENKNQALISNSHYDIISTGQAVGIGTDANNQAGNVHASMGAPAQSAFVGWDPAIWIFTQRAWPILAWQTP